jgi:anti-sigma regulatory factor (Ser/Thr protein kinase)
MGNKFHVNRRVGTILLPAEAISAAQARRFTRRICTEVGLDLDTVYIAVLLTSETVTNAIVHGHSEVRLTVTADAHGVRVEASDANSRHPVLQSQDADALDGRGVALLEAAATKWGVVDENYGKVVWFEVCVRPPPDDLAGPARNGSDTNGA